MLNMNQNNINHEEMNLKELILIITEYIKELKKNWLIILLTSMITSGLFIYKHMNFVPEYSASLKFVVEGQGGVSGGLGGLLGSFGIKKGGQINPYKLLEVGKSNKLLEEVLYRSNADGGIMADKIIDEYDLITSWCKNDDKFLNFSFNGPTKKDRLERSVLKKLKERIWGTPENRDDALGDFSLSDETGIYKINVTTTDENLSISLSTSLYNEIKHFFEDEIFSNQKQSSIILKNKVDSLHLLRQSKVLQLAKLKDITRGIYSKEQTAKETLLNQDIQSTNIAYAEILKNYELTDVNLKDMQPLFIEIDYPNSPLSPSKSSLKVNVLIGLVLGLFLSAVYIISRKIYRKALA